MMNAIFYARLGPTWIVGIAGMISGISNCLTPAAARYKFWLLFGARVIIGFCAVSKINDMISNLTRWFQVGNVIYEYCSVCTTIKTLNIPY